MPPKGSQYVDSRFQGNREAIQAAFPLRLFAAIVTERGNRACGLAHSESFPCRKASICSAMSGIPACLLIVLAA